MGRHKQIPCPECGKLRRSDHRKLRCRECLHGQPETRFHNNYEKKESGCWEWKAYCEPKGYGEFRMHGLKLSAHRASWMLNRGDIPEGLHVLHHCDNPPCVNPEHLSLGTHQDNMRDKVNKGRAFLNGRNLTFCRGEKHFNAKLSEAQAVFIKSSSEPSKVLAARFGIHLTHVNRIRRGVKWTHLGAGVSAHG